MIVDQGLTQDNQQSGLMIRLAGIFVGNTSIYLCLAGYLLSTDASCFFVFQLVGRFVFWLDKWPLDHSRWYHPSNEAPKIPIMEIPSHKMGISISPLVWVFAGVHWRHGGPRPVVMIMAEQHRGSGCFSIHGDKKQTAREEAPESQDWACSSKALWRA